MSVTCRIRLSDTRLAFLLCAHWELVSLAATGSAAIPGTFPWGDQVVSLAATRSAVTPGSYPPSTLNTAVIKAVINTDPFSHSSCIGFNLLGHYVNKHVCTLVRFDLDNALCSYKD